MGDGRWPPLDANECRTRRATLDHYSRFTIDDSRLFVGSAKLLVLELLPTVFDLAGQVAGEGLDGDVVVGAEPAPEDEARVELARPVRNLVRHLRFLFRHLLSSLLSLSSPVPDSVAEESDECRVRSDKCEDGPGSHLSLRTLHSSLLKRRSRAGTSRPSARSRRPRAPG